MCFLSRDARIELDVRWKFCHGHFVTTANLVKLIAAFIDANPFIEDLYKKKKKVDLRRVQKGDEERNDSGN